MAKKDSSFRLRASLTGYPGWAIQTFRDAQRLTDTKALEHVLQVWLSAEKVETLQMVKATLGDFQKATGENVVDMPKKKGG